MYIWSQSLVDPEKSRANVKVSNPEFIRIKKWNAVFIKHCWIIEDIFGFFYSEEGLKK